ncbi:MAG: hypothetical protein WB678_01045 [Stellaceae bacterium]
MGGKARTLSLTLAAVGTLICASATADAGGAVALTDGQLDHVTAGSAIVSSSAIAQATGLITIATTGSNSALGSNASVEDGFGSEGGVTVGTAVAYGTNSGAPGDPPASSSTDVSTGGVAQGNFTLTLSGGGKVSAGNMTIQAGFTSVYGVFIPGL